MFGLLAPLIYRCSLILLPADVAQVFASRSTEHRSGRATFLPSRVSIIQTCGELGRKLINLAFPITEELVIELIS